MQIVVDIDEEDYNDVIQDTFSGTPFENRVFSAVANSTPLTESDDCISREAVLEQIIANYLASEDIISFAHGLEDSVKALPSVQPKREKGEWIPIGYDGFADGNPVYDVWECSCCKEERYGDDESLPNFCPDCGADMRK